MEQDKRMALKETIREESKELMMGIKMGKVAFDLDEELAEMNAGDLFLEVIQEEIGKMRKHGFPEGIRRAMISQPMGGLTDEEILDARERAVAALRARGFHVVNPLFSDEWYGEAAMERRGVVQKPLCFLAKSLEEMSKCHVVYFCKGWEKARGCRIEHEAALAYGLDILYEVMPDPEDVPKVVQQEKCREYMDFGRAISFAGRGARIARKGWNGKKQYVELATHVSYRNPMGDVINAEHQDIGNAAFAFVGTSGVQLGWLASQADMLATDWYVVEAGA